jgi:hypothetical protein
VPVLPGSLVEPVWAPFAALLPARPTTAPTHPLGCHRRRGPDRVEFDHVVAAMMHGSRYERTATPGCSDRTIRRQVRTLADAGLTERLHTLVLTQFDRLIGLDLADLAVDGCITKAPGGGARAERSAATTVQLDRRDNSAATRAPLDRLGLRGSIARKGVLAPLQAGPRWVVERTQAWTNGSSKPRRCTERVAVVVDINLYLAAASVVTRCLIQRARARFRWVSRPITRRLK